MSVGPCAEKFSVASNDHGRMKKFFYNDDDIFT